MVIVRENVEDVYAGIEHMQTTTVAQCLKLMTAPGCERIIRAAYGLALAEERKKVTTCLLYTSFGFEKAVYAAPQ